MTAYMGGLNMCMYVCVCVCVCVCVAESANCNTSQRPTTYRKRFACNGFVQGALCSSLSEGPTSAVLDKLVVAHGSEEVVGVHNEDLSARLAEPKRLEQDGFDAVNLQRAVGVPVACFMEGVAERGWRWDCYTLSKYYLNILPLASNTAIGNIM